TRNPQLLVTSRHGFRVPVGHVFPIQLRRPLPGAGDDRRRSGERARDERSREMKDGPAYHAASAGEQTVENSSGGAGSEVRHTDTLTEKDKPRGKARTGASVPGLTFPRFFTEAGV